MAAVAGAIWFGGSVDKPAPVAPPNPAASPPTASRPVAAATAAAAPVTLAAAEAGWDDGLGKSVGQIRRSLARPLPAVAHRGRAADGLERRIQSLELRWSRDKF